MLPRPLCPLALLKLLREMLSQRTPFLLPLLLLLLLQPLCDVASPMPRLSSSAVQLRFASNSDLSFRCGICMLRSCDLVRPQVTGLLATGAWRRDA